MPPKHFKKFEAMKEAGRISSTALRETLDSIEVGISLLELDSIAEKVIISEGAKPAFKGFQGYSYSTCINVNEGIVHGVPTKYKLKEGDLVSVDLGASYNGYSTDQCRTVEVKTNYQADFLSAGKKALEEAISKAVLGNRVGDISFAMQQRIESSGYQVSRELVGHGIGKKVHEPPQIPCYGSPGTGSELKIGMCLAIEVIYSQGSPSMEVAEDGWTLVTLDRELSAVFEDTVGITETGPLVFTSF